MINCTQHIKLILIFLILGFSSQSQAGEPLMVVQSSTHKYAVTLHGRGDAVNSYEWTVTRRESLGIPVIENVDYEVIPLAYAGVNEVYIKWLKEGNYNLHVVETSATYGCQSSRQVAVDVVHNDEAYTLEETTFESCFGDERELTIAMNTFFKDDETLASRYFPLKVKLEIYNGTITMKREIEISTPDNDLVIGKMIEDADRQITYIITLAEITDRFGAQLNARNNDNVIVYSIHSKPRITFSSN